MYVNRLDFIIFTRECNLSWGGYPLSGSNMGVLFLFRIKAPVQKLWENFVEEENVFVM